ncbi:MAG: hopanoid biosynthesis-associated protein HpnK [Candidatus Eremiobacteraeota bacterium]|nr:hopanoid biosynthesis-associated protein HpnK [Candidatus Eremiobacteraeota bacterium]
MNAERSVIFTADDFGLAQEVNEAVERAHREGLLSSASLMVAAPATADAIARARRLETLRVGLHVVLVNGTPLQPRESVTNLVNARGEFPSNLFAAGVQYFASPKARRQLRQEIRAQFEAFRATGLALDHVNAQNHFHVHPTVFGMILEIGQDYGAHAVRIPYEPFWPSWRAARNRWSGRFANATLLWPWLALMRSRARRAGLLCNDALFGMNDSGGMTSKRVRDIVNELPVGLSEIYLHPATRAWPAGERAMPGYAFSDELGALLDPHVLEAVRARGAALTTYSELVNARVA